MRRRLVPWHYLTNVANKSRYLVSVYSVKVNNGYCEFVRFWVSGSQTVYRHKQLGIYGHIYCPFLLKFVFFRNKFNGCYFLRSIQERRFFVWPVCKIVCSSWISQQLVNWCGWGFRYSNAYFSVKVMCKTLS